MRTRAHRLRWSSTRAATTLIAAGAMCYAAADAGRVSAQTAACDPGLEQPSTSSDPHGYRLRGDRCEGICAQPVANTALVVASFLESSRIGAGGRPETYISIHGIARTLESWDYPVHWRLPPSQLAAGVSHTCASPSRAQDTAGG